MERTLWAEGSCPPGLLALSSLLLPIHRDVLKSPLGQSGLCGAASEQILRVFQTVPFLTASVSASVFRGSFLLPMFPCRGLAFCTIVFADSLLSDRRQSRDLHGGEGECRGLVPAPVIMPGPFSQVMCPPRAGGAPEPHVRTACVRGCGG